MTLPTVTEGEIRAAVLDHVFLAVCLECHDRSEGIEPDTKGLHCRMCGKMAVWGLEQALLAGKIEIVEGD